MLAADLQEPVELICEMLEEWRAGAKFVVCSRSGREDSLMSRILAALYYKLVRLLILPDFPAGEFDLMLMDKIMLPYMIDGNRVMSPQVRAFWLGFTPTVLSYHRSERPYGRSGWTIWQKLFLVLDTFMSYYMDASRFARDDLVCLAGRLQFYIRPVCAGFCPAGPDGICRSTPHSPNGLVAQDDMQAWRIAV